MTSTPQPPVAEYPDPATEARSHHPSYVPPAPTAGRARRTFSARVTAAIGAGALVVGTGLGLLTGGLVGPGGPGGGPGGAPPGTSTSQDGTGTGTGTGTGQQGTAPGGTSSDGTAPDGATTSGT